MGENLKYENSLRERDAILGRAVARRLGDHGDAMPCPAPEEMAALVDGHLSGDERDVLLGHLAVCGNCRQVFTTTRALVQEKAAVTERRWYVIPSALAAAAVLVVALTLTLGQSPTGSIQVSKQEGAASPTVTVPEKEGSEAAKTAGTAVAWKEAPLPTAGRMARMLAQAGDVQQLASLAGVQDKTYGFAGNSDGNALSFRIGVSAMDLEIAFLADDSDRAQAQAARLGSLLQAATGADDAADLERLVERLERGGKPSSFAGGSGMVERSLSRRKVVMARLGAWAEGARLAAKTGNREYFAGGVPEYFRKGLAGAGVSQEAAAALRELDRKVKDRNGIDFGSVEKDLDDLMRAF